MIFTAASRYITYRSFHFRCDVILHFCIINVEVKIAAYVPIFVLITHMEFVTFELCVIQYNSE